MKKSNGKSGNPFKKLTSIHDSKELLDIVFRRASKAKTDISVTAPAIIKAKKRETARIRTIEKELVNRLTRIVKEFPSVEQIHPFYSQLTDILVGLDNLKMALGSVHGTIRVIKRISNEHIRKIRRSTTPQMTGVHRKAYYGRIASLIKKLDARFQLLAEARDKLKVLPSIQPENFFIVVAGFPNVGKSCFVKFISTANPEIAEYPFTTKKVILGHFDVEGKEETFKCQIVDTPGLLDRPLSQRNEIERQAIVALKNLANVIIYMIDSSSTCGYPLEEQISLAKELKRNFKDVPIIYVINKIDLADHESIEKTKEEIGGIIFCTIASEGEGIKEAVSGALKLIDSSLKLP